MTELLLGHNSLPTPAKPIPKPHISLETIPANGIISSYGVCGSDYELDSYAENFLEKLGVHSGKTRPG